jgi:hypothetical protein
MFIWLAWAFSIYALGSSFGTLTSYLKTGTLSPDYMEGSEHHMKLHSAVGVMFDFHLYFRSHSQYRIVLRCGIKAGQQKPTSFNCSLSNIKGVEEDEIFFSSCFSKSG